MMLILKTVFIMMIFGAILFLAYLTTRFIGKKTGAAMKGKYIKVIEVVPLGIDKHLHLIKAGNDFVLVASAGRSIQYLTTVTLEEAEELESLSSEETAPFDFKNILEKYSHLFDKKRSKVSKENINTKENIASSIQRIRNVSQKIQSTSDKHGDDSAHAKEK